MTRPRVASKGEWATATVNMRLPTFTPFLPADLLVRLAGLAALSSVRQLEVGPPHRRRVSCVVLSAADRRPVTNERCDVSVVMRGCDSSSGAATVCSRPWHSAGSPAPSPLPPFVCLFSGGVTPELEPRMLRLNLLAALTPMRPESNTDTMSVSFSGASELARAQLL